VSVKFDRNRQFDPHQLKIKSESLECHQLVIETNRLKLQVTLGKNRGEWKFTCLSKYGQMETQGRLPESD